jgi:hypothetical protein
MTAASGQVWTEADVRGLGVRTDLRTAAAVLGLSEWTAYRLAGAGEFPVPVIRVAGRYIVPVSGLLDLLGLAPTGSGHRLQAGDQQQPGHDERPGSPPPGRGIVRQLRSTS